MEENADQVKRILASVLISLYGLAISFLTFFMFMWDNKGSKSIWDKSTTDWAIITWLVIASFVVWLGVFKCSSSTHKSFSLVFILSAIFIVHILIVAFQAENEAVYYLGIPHILLGAGIYLWWSSLEHAKTKPYKSSHANP